MTTLTQIATRYRVHALRAQAQELRDPARKCGPSHHEADESARAVDNEADALSEELYWATALRTP